MGQDQYLLIYNTNSPRILSTSLIMPELSLFFVSPFLNPTHRYIWILFYTIHSLVCIKKSAEPKERGRIVKGYKCPAQMILAGAPTFSPVQHNSSPYLTRSSKPGLLTENISRKRSTGPLRGGEWGKFTTLRAKIVSPDRIHIKTRLKMIWIHNVKNGLPVDELFWESLLPGGGSPLDLHTVLDLLYLHSLGFFISPLSVWHNISSKVYALFWTSFTSLDQELSRELLLHFTNIFWDMI